MNFFSRNKKSIKHYEKHDWDEHVIFDNDNILKKGATQQNFEFKKNIDLKGVSNSKGTKQGLRQRDIKINSKHIKILKNANNESSAKELKYILKMTNSTKFKDSFLNPLIDMGFFEVVIADKPTSPYQQYRLTGKFVNRIV